MRHLRVRVAWVVTLAVVMPPGAGAQQDPPGAPSEPASQSPPAAVAVQEPPWLRIGGEFRERLEGAAGIGFVSEGQDLYSLSRFRFTAAVTPSKAFTFLVEAHDARVGLKGIGPTGPPFRAPLDLRRAFADLGPATGPVRVRIGRQVLLYGEQRLLGPTDWQNASRTFDAAKVTFRIAAFSVDAFAASLVRILNDEFDKSGGGNRLAAVYATSPKLVRDATLESYVVWKRDTTPQPGLVGTTRITTIGARFAGKVAAGLDYGIETALQRGSHDAGDVRAWAGHWQLRESLPWRNAPRVAVEYNYASGDEDPSDAFHGTFDPLYPSAHNKHGLADQIGWKNVRHLRTGLELTPIRSVSVAFSYHSFWLAERRDAVYAPGRVLAPATPQAASSHIGYELDIGATHEITPQIQISTGYAHTIAGRFLTQATPGADHRYAYLMVTYVLLAEK